MRAVPVVLLIGGAALGTHPAGAQPPVPSSQLPPAAVAQGLLGQTPAAAPAAPAPTVTAQAGNNRAVDVLIRQAERWLAMERYDLAASSIERALAAEPRNVQALTLGARIAAAQNNRTAAQSYATRLREAGGTPAETQAVTEALRGAAIDRNALEEARSLARAGRADEAAQRYRAIFGSQGPTPQYAQEYYAALAASRTAGAQGRAGLERLADEPGATSRARLVFAQNQTYQPETRADGIRRLQALTGDREVGIEARAALRQALAWSIGDPAYAAATQAFIDRYGADEELSRGLAATRQATGPAAVARQEGFAALEAGGLQRSAQQFEAALAANPNDADALGGLGIVRLRQNRPADARQLLERAIAADPSKAQNWQQALDAAIYPAEIAEGRAALRRNDIEAADRIARSAARRAVQDQTDSEVLLGEIALRRGDAPAAEQRFRTALARRPGFGLARDGLAQALRAQGRLSELPRLAGPAPSGGGATTGPGSQLRAEADRSGDPVVAEALLRQAMAQAPGDPWIRLDLARALRRQGRAQEGRALVEEGAARGGRDGTYAAALFADEDGRYADAEAYLNQIPPGSRTADMSRLQSRLRVQRDVSAAAAMLRSSPAVGRTQLLTIAARPDPTGATAAAVIRAFGEADDRFGAAEAARVGAAANRVSGTPARLAIAGALLGAGLDAEALAIADQAEAGNPTPEQRRDIASLRSGAAIRAADRLNQDGRQAQAFERLRPALERNPDDPDANLALARLYQGARQPEEAQRVAEGMLARNPRSFEARQGAIDAAIALRQRARAEALLAEARELFPRDSRVSLLDARVARAFNDDARARRSLETAAAQRAAEVGQLAGRPGGVAAEPRLANPFVRPGAAQPLPSVDGVPVAGDRVSREIAQELAALERNTGPRLAAQPGLRLRSGSSGLDRLQEVNATAEGEISPAAIGGRLMATVTGVTLETGRLASDANSLQRFGTNAAYGTRAQPRTTASGAILGLSYTRGDSFRADIGSSPLGFPTTTVIGGLEIAPQIGGIRLRLTGERRTVNDSLLSWAGQRDPVTQRSWGAVTRAGGRAQVELPLGPGYAYAGGGYYMFEGENVRDNARIEAGAGFSYPFWRRPDGELSVGTDLVYFAYDRNLRYFTLGHGGYYSPQSFVALNVPVDYRGRTGDFSYRLGGTAGYAVWREQTAPLYPNDSNLQALAQARAAADPTAMAFYPGQNKQNFVGGVRGDIDYAVTPNLNLSAGFRYDVSANWDEMRAFLRLNGRF